MPDKKINNISDKSELKDYILNKGCGGARENERIYDKWFRFAPRYLFRAADRKYKLTDKLICDAGCGYGMNLVYCRPDSYGIEIEPRQSAFAKSLGLNVHNRDILSGDLSDLPKVDAVWSSAVLEHVDSPHIFLRKLWNLLKPDGLLVLYVPTIPVFYFLRHLPYFGKYFIGHRHGDHINAFSMKTIKFFCERAGFKTIEVTPFYPGIFELFNKLFNVLDGCTYIGRKNEDWEYPFNAVRKKTDNTQGYELKK